MKPGSDCWKDACRNSPSWQPLAKGAPAAPDNKRAAKPAHHPARFQRKQSCSQPRRRGRVTLYQFGGTAEGIPDRRKRPIRGIARCLERCGLTSKCGTLMGDAFDQAAALPVQLNQAFCHDHWLP
jgi:hypothetical protein